METRMSGRVFDHPNPIGFYCPVCRTKADAPVVLVGVGPVEGGLQEAVQVHAECQALVAKMAALPEVK